MAQVYRPSRKEYGYYEQCFDYADDKKLGQIFGPEAVKFLTSSGLVKSQLKKVRDLRFQSAFV